MIKYINVQLPKEHKCRKTDKNLKYRIASNIKNTVSY